MQKIIKLWQYIKDILICNKLFCLLLEKTMKIQIKIKEWSLKSGPFFILIILFTNKRKWNKIFIEKLIMKTFNENYRL